MNRYILNIFILIIFVFLIFPDITFAKEESKPVLKGQAVIIDINSNKLEYMADQNEFIATGNVKIDIEEQNFRLEANKVTYNQDTQIIIAENNVKITKNGNIIYGGYAKVNLDKESALIDKPLTTINKMKIKADNANVYTDHLEALKGSAVVDNTDLRFNLSSNAFNQKEAEKLNSQKLSAKQENKPPTYKITCRELIIDRTKDRNTVTLKSASIWLGKIKLATIPSLQLSSDKDKTDIESSLPEIGRIKELGIYMGPSHVFYLPKNSSLKFSPILSLDGQEHFFGAGSIAKFKSDFNDTQIGYSTASNKLLLYGEQKTFIPSTKIVYGSNSYVNDSIIGDIKPKYILEVVDNRKLASALNFDLNVKSSAGYAEDYNRDFGTFRGQLQGNLINSNPIFKIKDDLLQLRLVSQFGVSVYGNGDTFGIIRGGPQLDGRIGRLTLSSTYYQAGLHSRSPFEFDRYNSGRSNLVASGNLKITDHLSIGHLRSLNLSKDNGNNLISVENQFYAIVGPDDVKFRLGYDVVRKRTMFNVDLLLGSGRTGIEFDKLRYNQIQK